MYICIYKIIFFKSIYLSTNYGGSCHQRAGCQGALAKALPGILQKNDAKEVPKGRSCFYVTLAAFVPPLTRCRWETRSSGLGKQSTGGTHSCVQCSVGLCHAQAALAPCCRVLLLLPTWLEMSLR